jgi:hypothetical protein
MLVLLGSGRRGARFGTAILVAMSARRLAVLLLIVPIAIAVDPALATQVTGLAALHLASATLHGAVGDSTWCDWRLSSLRGTIYGYAIDSLPAEPRRQRDPGRHLYPVDEPERHRVLSGDGQRARRRPRLRYRARRPPPQNSLMIRPHARGGSFLQSLSGSGEPGEWRLALDDHMRSAERNSFWYGYHQGYDIESSSNVPPLSGTVIDYTMRRVVFTVEWARRRASRSTSG